MQAAASVHVPTVRASTAVVLAKGRKAPGISSCDFNVLMVKRAAKSAFMPSLFVFPGGKVDRSDRKLSCTANVYQSYDLIQSGRLLGDYMSSECWADRFAVLREVFEESGLLLAERIPKMTNPFQQTTSAYPYKAASAFDLNTDVEDGYYNNNEVLYGQTEYLYHPANYIDYHEYMRREVQRPQQNFQQRLKGIGLQPMIHSLIPFSRWVTPEAEERRFDTNFYLCPVETDMYNLEIQVSRSLDQGKKHVVVNPEPDHNEQCHQFENPHLAVPGEIEEAIWVNPVQALEMSRDTIGDFRLAPPTAYVLSQLVHKTYDQVMDIGVHNKIFTRTVPHNGSNKPDKQYYMTGPLKYEENIKFYPRVKHGVYEHLTLPAGEATVQSDVFLPMVPTREKNELGKVTVHLPGDLDHEVTKLCLHRILNEQVTEKQFNEALQVPIGRIDNKRSIANAYYNTKATLEPTFVPCPDFINASLIQEVPPADFSIWFYNAYNGVHSSPIDTSVYSLANQKDFWRTAPLPLVAQYLEALRSQVFPATSTDKFVTPIVALKNDSYRLVRKPTDLYNYEKLASNHFLGKYINVRRVVERSDGPGWHVYHVDNSTIPPTC